MSTLEPLSDQLSVTSAGSNNALWFAVQTRARSEKKVTAQLQTKGIETFLPLLCEVHRWSDRRQQVHQPLFPGYAFVHIDASPELRLSILNTLGVCGFVGVRGVGLPIPDKEIEDVRTVVTNPVRFAPYPFLRAGQKVRLRGGCLDGVEGTLLSTNSDQSVVVSIELMRRSLAVRINGYDFELV
jgi:transcription antitermination factor NusG